LLHLLDDAPAAAELHRARVDQVHLGLRDAPVAFFDQGAGDTAPADIGRDREADGTATGDEDRGSCCHGRRI